MEVHHTTRMLLASLWLCAGCLAAVADDPPDPPRDVVTDRLVERRITVDDLERRYRLFVPDGDGPAMPLVLVLHGGGFGEKGVLQVIRYTQMTALAKRERFIVVYPAGIEGNWNDGRGVDFIPAQRDDIDDVKFIREVVREVADQYPVDSNRVFSTGISNGAFMSHRLAAEAADLVLAVAAVAGGMAPKISAEFAPSHPVSVFVIHGDADPACPINGGHVGPRFGRKRGKIVPTSEAVTNYVKSNGIQGDPAVEMLPDTNQDDGTTTEATVYSPGENGARVQVYRVKNGGHTWPGTRPYMKERLIGKTSQDYHASLAIWEFFKSIQSRPTGGARNQRDGTEPVRLGSPTDY